MGVTSKLPSPLTCCHFDSHQVSCSSFKYKYLPTFHGTYFSRSGCFRCPARTDSRHSSCGGQSTLTFSYIPTSELSSLQIADTSFYKARQFLESVDWNLEAAAQAYYQSQEPEEQQDEPATEEPYIPAPPQRNITIPPIGNPQGGRTLGDSSDAVPQPIPTTSSMASSNPTRQSPKKKFATLGDLASSGRAGGHAGRSRGHSDDDDDDDYKDDENPDLFAGGEKSGLAVQNPDDLKRKLLERAKKYGSCFLQFRQLNNNARRNLARPGGDDPTPASSNFTGSARTLGGDDTTSTFIPDPSAEAPRRAPRVERVLHYWADGFSVDDGPLHRSDDPANQHILRMINAGQAPVDLMNVEADQEVDVRLIPHKENYVKPKGKYKAFSGEGQRLGAPTPGEESSIPGGFPATTAASSAPANAATSAATPAAQPPVNVDDSQPTVSLQIRLGDGTRLSSRFNTTHTIGDVYDFVNASSSASQQRAWVLMTTFPSKELADKEAVLGDLEEFKRGGVVVQKWT